MKATSGSERLNRLLDRLDGVSRNGSGIVARCPAHEDCNPSLSIAETRDGTILLRCHAGCEARAIVAAAGLTLSDLFPPKSGAGRRILATYDYRDADGRLLFQAVRKEQLLPADPKCQFRRPDRHGGWIWNLKGVERIPYRLPELREAVLAGRTIFVPEGEKDVESLVRLGLPATCNPGGAGKWRDAYSQELKGVGVVVCQDNDEPGAHHAQDVARSLSGIAASARILLLPDLPKGGDVSDWLAAGGTKERLIELAAAVPEWQAGEQSGESTAEEPPPAEDEPAWAPSRLINPGEEVLAARETFVDDYIAYARERTDAPACFHEAMALQALSVCVGRRACLSMAAGNVYASLWTLVIAPSTIYRKSTAMDYGREIVELVSRSLLTANDFTPQRFVAILAENDGKPLLFLRDEFSGFYDGLNRLEFMSGLKETLCNVYDGRPFRREKMRPRAKKGEEEPDESTWIFDVQEPFLSMAVATTRERFFDVARPTDIHSGFLVRFALILPPRGHKGSQAHRILTREMEAQKTDLARRLSLIRQSVIQPGIDADALERFNRYQAALESETLNAPNAELIGVVNGRIGWMALRVAMLLASEKDAGQVRLPHLLRGISIAETWRHNAIETLGALAPSKFERQAARVVHLVNERGEISRRDVMNALHLNLREIAELEGTLIERGQIRIVNRRTRTKTSVWYETSQPSQSSPRASANSHGDGDGKSKSSQSSQEQSSPDPPPENENTPRDDCDGCSDYRSADGDTEEILL